MRTELKPLLHQPVVVFGHMTSVKRDVKVEKVCLKKVLIYKWDFHKTYQNQPSTWWDRGQPLRGNPVQTDHLWLLNDDPEASDNCRFLPEKLGMYSVHNASGYVVRYVRANGSVDYGVRSIPPLPKDFFDFLGHLRKRCDWKTILEKIEIAEHFEGGAFVATKRQTPKEVTQHIQRFKKEAEQKLGKAEAALGHLSFTLVSKGASS